MAGTKLHIVSCFALFALLVAPFAWQQTQVQRTELPADRIAALAWNRSRLARPARHVVRLFVRSDLHDASVASAVATLSAAAPHSVEYIAASLVLTPSQQETLATLEPQPLDDALLNVLPADGDAFSLVLLCRSSQAADAATTITVGKHRHAWSNACVPSEDASLASALAQLTQHHLFPSDDDHNVLGFAPAKSNRARVAVKYRLQFSLLQEGGDAQWGWDFDALHKRYLTPVLNKLSSIAQLTVEHQTVHYARLAKEVHSDAAAGVHYIYADDLKHFKSTNDFLTTSVLADREQVLHFMAALPSRDHAPLVIKSSERNREATAFEIPGWGVVVVLDPRELLHSTLAEAKELQRVMGRFISELRTLLGLPSFVKRARAAQQQQTGLSFLPSPQHGVAQWELDVVVRSRLRRHVKSSIETLQSILQLVNDMPELSVLDRVAQRITHAMELVERVLAAADGDTTQDEAALLEIARLAVEEADAAYYDHTMIRQLYFPQEQLLGVFAPLLAPLLLPFFVGWLRELKHLRAKRKAKAAASQ